MTQDAQPAAEPAAVEPPEGQGAESGNDGNGDLYKPFLEGVPEEIHDQVLVALKAQDAEFTKRFQSSADRTKPFEDIGVFDQDPEAIGQYLQLDQVMTAAQNGDEKAKEAIYNWWDQVGEQLEFYGEDGTPSEGDEPSGIEGAEDLDPLDDDFQEKLQAMIQREAQQLVSPLIEQQTQQQEAEAQRQAEQQGLEQVDGWVSQVKEANPGLFEGEEGEAKMEEVLELALLFKDSENPVQAGFEKYQALVGKGEAGLFAQKAQQPSITPEGSGPTDTSSPPITMKNAREAALEHLRNGNQMQT